MNQTRIYLLPIALGAAMLAASSPTVALASTAPGLGNATSYAVLAGTTVTNTGNSVITGDVGVSPGSACTGLPAPCTGGGPGSVSGAIHAGDAQSLQAQSDATAAYGIASSSPCNFDKTGQNLGGQTLTPGTYCQTTAPTLSGTLTLNGNGVFIFRIGSTLITAPGAIVSSINGAQPCNVFWQVSSSATLDTTTNFVGTIMASSSISLNNGASIDGRALAQTGQVSLINNRITAPTTCSAVTVSGPTPTPTPTSTTISSPSPTSHIPGISTPSTGAGQGLGMLPYGLLLLPIGAGLLATVIRRRRTS